MVNETEETQKIILQAQYLDEEYIREKLLTVNGDIDMLDEINARIDAEAMKRTKPVPNIQDEDEEEEAE